jgi:hypothetical protein
MDMSGEDPYVIADQAYQEGLVRRAELTANPQNHLRSIRPSKENHE